jgi:hypothetical protein
MRSLRSLLVIGCLAAAGLLSVATSAVQPRQTVPHHAFLDYCGAANSEVEVLVTNDTNRPVKARFLGPTFRELEVAPGSNRIVRLSPGDYAFELGRSRRVLDRQWKTLQGGRRYLYFHKFG